MAVTPSDAIAAIEEAMGRGVLEVTDPDGGKVRYATFVDMEKAIAYFRGQQRANLGRAAVSASVGAFYRS